MLITRDNKTQPSWFLCQQLIKEGYGFDVEKLTDDDIIKLVNLLYGYMYDKIK